MSVIDSGCWVEVRSLITSKLEPANFVSVLDVLYGLGKSFRFIMVNTKDKEVVGRFLVRFYLQVCDELARVQVSNIIRALLDVEVVSVDFSVTERFLVCLDLELAKNYALPVVNFQQDQLVNLVDELVASFAGAQVCLEVVAVADPNAVLGVQKFVYKKTSHDPWLGKALLDQGTDFLGQAIGINQKEKPTKKSPQTKINSWSRECVKNAEHKLYSNLFTCQIHVYGNSLRNANGVKSILPSAMNRFRTFKQHKNRSVTSKLKTPSKHRIRNNVLCNLWWTIPICLLLLAGVLGWFNPLKIISSTIATVDLVLPVLAAGLVVCLFIAFKKRQPVVLSTLELAQMIGLPSAVAKLPVALGKVPTARMQLGPQQQTAEKQKTKPAPTTKKAKPPAKTDTQTTHHHLHAFLNE
ncbi:MAG: hypothetical protein LBC03_03085 [Nitrososphaerota archaeon]|jgi:hypothetical protein|nr:hypothetical protein [Nitrososphaerota archaeon]